MRLTSIKTTYDDFKLIWEHINVDIQNNVLWFRGGRMRSGAMTSMSTSTRVENGKTIVTKKSVEIICILIICIAFICINLKMSDPELLVSMFNFFFEGWLRTASKLSPSKRMVGWSRRRSTGRGFRSSGARGPINLQFCSPCTFWCLAEHMKGHVHIHEEITRSRQHPQSLSLLRVSFRNIIKITIMMVILFLDNINDRLSKMHPSLELSWRSWFVHKVHSS